MREQWLIPIMEAFVEKIEAHRALSQVFFCRVKMSGWLRAVRSFRDHRSAQCIAMD